MACRRVISKCALQQWQNEPKHSIGTIRGVARRVDRLGVRTGNRNDDVLCYWTECFRCSTTGNELDESVWTTRCERRLFGVARRSHIQLIAPESAESKTMATTTMTTYIACGWLVLEFVVSVRGNAIGKRPYDEWSNIKWSSFTKLNYNIHYVTATRNALKTRRPYPFCAEFYERHVHTYSSRDVLRR